MLLRAGVPQSTVMETCGWKTAAMFRRYAIDSSSDQRAAVAMLEKLRAEEQAAALAPGTAPRRVFRVCQCPRGQTELDAQYPRK